MKGLGKCNCLKQRTKWQRSEMADGKELAKHDCLNEQREWHKENSSNKGRNGGEQGIKDKG